jgi:ATP-dependent exoDNAse (exonuclease V) beta subunit
MPDDVFELEDSTYHIVDYKTARLTETQDELFPKYEVQINAYAYIG